jgi:hypothetical protein
VPLEPSTWIDGRSFLPKCGPRRLSRLQVRITDHRETYEEIKTGLDGRGIEIADIFGTSLASEAKLVENGRVFDEGVVVGNHWTDRDKGEGWFPSGCPFGGSWLMHSARTISPFGFGLLDFEAYAENCVAVPVLFNPAFRYVIGVAAREMIMIAQVECVLALWKSSRLHWRNTVV